MMYRNSINAPISIVAVSVGLALSSAHAATVAYWTYDSGTAGTPFSATPVVDASGNGNTMFGFNDFYGPSYSADTASGSGLSQRSDAFHQDGYTAGAPVNTWSPLTWTIELAVRLDSVAGWNTIVGRDGSSGGPKADFYIQNNGIDDRMRLDFKTLDGSNYTLDSDFVPAANQWYGFAFVSDGTTVKMYADKLDNNGYVQVGSLPLTGSNNALANAGGAVWTFGRGWYNGGFVDHISGNIDNVRFSDAALTPSQLLQVVPEPSALTLCVLGGLAVRSGCKRKRNA
jgi:hypothetical protein